jgi:protease I
VLCGAGVVTGRRATCFSPMKDDIINAGAEYEDSEVVIHGNLVTSRAAEDLPAFCRAVLRSLDTSVAA